MFVRDDIYNQWIDNKKLFQNPNVTKVISALSGSAILKAMATGINPLFVISNIPRDFAHILLHTNAFSKFIPLGMAQLTAGSVKSWAQMAKGMEDKSFRDFVEHGGMMDFLFTQGGINSKNLFSDIVSMKNNPEAKRILGKAFDYFTVLNKYSEIGFRLAVFNKVMSDGMKKINAQSLTDKEKAEAISDLKYNAAAQAREIIDFNQGGFITKDLESVLPYINASVQGARVAANYAVENPVTYGLKMTQAAGIGASLVFGVSAALISMFREDEDDDETLSEIWVETMEGVSEFNKRTNFIFPLGIRDEDGELKYLKISKTQQARPFFALMDSYVENMIRESVGKEKVAFDKTKDKIIKSFVSDYLPVDPTSLESLFTRNPLAGGIIESYTGKSFYKGTDISYDITKGFPRSREGYYSKTMPKFYKDMSDEFGLSPDRTRNFVEKFITSPSTNPMVSLMYFSADKASSKLKGTELEEDIDIGLIDGMSKKFIGTTSKFNRAKTRGKEVLQLLDDEAVIAIDKYQKIKDLAKTLKGKTSINKEIKDYVYSLEKEYQKKTLDKIIKLAKTPKSDWDKMSILYARTNRNKAILFKYTYGELTDNQLRNALIEMKGLGLSVSEDFINEYKKIKDL